MKVLFFARTRDLAGVASVAWELPPGTTVAEVRRRLAIEYPRMAGLLADCAIAVDDDFAADDAVVPMDAEVAVLPPVSGG